MSACSLENSVVARISNGYTYVCWPDLPPLLGSLYTNVVRMYVVRMFFGQQRLFVRSSTLKVSPSGHVDTTRSDSGIDTVGKRCKMEALSKHVCGWIGDENQTALLFPSLSRLRFTVSDRQRDLSCHANRWSQHNCRGGVGRGF